MRIRIISTGGTIDKQYDARQGKLDFAHSNIKSALEQGRCTVDTTIESVFAKDSQEFTAEDREKIILACRNSPEEKVLITHGTDTLVETAALLASLSLPKTIVLTGSMIPLNINHSDGLFNLGGAITAAQCLAHGVYIAINGEIFDWDNAVKNHQQLRFETIKKAG